MESQGHYMETFSYLLVFHLCIDLLIFCYLFIVNIYTFFILSNFNYNYLGIFYYYIFPQNRHIHQMQSDTSKITSFLLRPMDATEREKEKKNRT